MYDSKTIGMDYEQPGNHTYIRTLGGVLPAANPDRM